MDWVSNTLHPFVVKSNGGMPLAAHLCRERFNEVLRGEGGFLERLTSLGFRRVQIHATAVNGVDTSDLSGGATRLMTLVSQFLYLEFIIQRSDETSELWKAVEKAPPEDYEVGLAGGIGPRNVGDVLGRVLEKAKGRSIWIDMESILRSECNGKMCSTCRNA